MMEGALLSRRAEKQPLYKKKKYMCVAAQQEVNLLNYLAILYLHGVCFSRGGLPIGKDSPIVSTQYIYHEKRRKHVKKKERKTIKEENYVNMKNGSESVRHSQTGI